MANKDLFKEEIERHFGKVKRLVFDGYRNGVNYFVAYFESGKASLFDCWRFSDDTVSCCHVRDL